ncbi:protein serine/threonine phosphatase with PAS/PAC(s) sensor(s) [Pseudodesulfovibrio mercurii]|uniref:Protein serine/threonine phosphatase with PAS/PAC(S) sensor(S) n=1 Tax=Pseudodesulfovibrio mercurii TaxID=641491 RepID=F0JBM9_9BACT|nr:SpoIIE family protein phosphatase [Pseudodesulfovibrio mercurii]EGB15532.1 protein serine/threonine phosphatase with PAS/PAC(s) sensor(s) [Pseudodesulfovibrio mercurii]
MAEPSAKSPQELIDEIGRLRAQLKHCRENRADEAACGSAMEVEIEQLREARETVGLVNVIVENSPAVVFRRLADPPNTLVYISENIRQWGYSATDFLSGGRTFEEIVHPADKTRMGDEIEECRARNVEEYAQEYRIVTADGETRWVSDKTSVVRDADGRRIYNQGVLVDVTANKRAQEALEASEFKFRRTIEGAAEGYLLMDRDLVLREVNDAYCRMLGFDREELVGKRPHDFATLAYQRFLESNSEHPRDGVQQRFEGAMVHRDGHAVPVLVNANTLLDADGGFLGHVAFVADLTEQKKALNLAAEVQKSLLPRTAPRIPGLDVAGRSVPSELTGGDYFDYFEEPDPDRPVLSVAVGDISGHGVDAALLMTTARGFLRMRAGQPGSPDQIVTEMNRHLAEDLYGSGRFMTLFFLRLDAAGAKAQWVRAGHDPALIYCPVHDAFTELGAEAGLPLGVLRETRYREESGELLPGQLIAIGTDGIWEARNARGEMFGKARFKAVLRRRARDRAQAILDAVFEAVRDFTGKAGLADDVTLVIIKHGATP